VLAELAGPGDPAASYEIRESVQLAFLTVIQLLPPRQRAALLRWDVLGLSAANLQPAVAAYQRDGAIARAYGIMVFTVRDGTISEITGFADPALFPLFGLSQQAPPGGSHGL